MYTNVKKGNSGVSFNDTLLNFGLREGLRGVGHERWSNKNITRARVVILQATRISFQTIRYHLIFIFIKFEDVDIVTS